MQNKLDLYVGLQTEHGDLRELPMLMEDFFSKAPDESIIGVLKRTRVTDSLLPIVRGFAIKTLVERASQRNTVGFSLRQVLQEIAQESGLIFSTHVEMNRFSAFSAD
ncbi:MAG: hypothetical protein NZL93_06805 [Chthoniobacterales bacterium]|nr:hypothetical protein [Chthoniobacterales bacterium]